MLTSPTSPAPNSHFYSWHSEASVPSNNIYGQVVFVLTVYVPCSSIGVLIFEIPKA